MGLFDRLFGRKKEELEEKPQLEEQAEESYQTTETEVPFEAESQPLAASNEETAETQEVEFVLEEKIESTDSAISEQEFAPTTQQADLSEPVLEDEESPEQVLAEAEEQSETSANQALESSSESEAATESRDYYQELQERLAAAREQINYESEQEVSSEQEASTSSKVDSTEYGEEAEEELTPAETSESSTEYQEESVQDKYDRSLKKTRTGFGARLNAFFANFRSVDEDFFEDLEELLITSDVGVQVASNLTEDLRYEARLENAKKPEALRQLIIEKLVDIYEKDGRFNEKINFQNGLTVMLFVGVNGVGKTTSIGKLAYKYKQEGKKVMLVAADTFRAGAVAQLAEWGRRVDVPVVTGPEKSDPASVVFDGLERAKAENVDILMIDTAGQSHGRAGKNRSHYQAGGSSSAARNLPSFGCFHWSKCAGSGQRIFKNYACDRYCPD